MALFTDGPIANLSDLRDYETSILDVASTENIDATAKLQIAQREIGIELATFLQRRGVPVSTAQELSSVCVSDSLVNAHALHTLSLVYRDAYNSQMNERYRGKWQTYVAAAEKALQQLFAVGVGLVAGPVAKASMPTIHIEQGGQLPARAYTVKVAVVGTGGMTGEHSNATVVEVPGGWRVRVAAPFLPNHARGWLVYAGEGDADASRQVSLPLDPHSDWTEPADGLRRDLPEWPRQKPDFYVTNNRQLLRG